MLAHAGTHGLPGLLILLACVSCAPSSPPSGPPDAGPRILLFAADGLPLADDLRASLVDADLEFEERRPDAPLFPHAFGTTGRLGLAWVDDRDRVLSVLPGTTPIAEVRRRDRLVRARREAWANADALARARLQLDLRAEAPAETGLRALLDEAESADLRALLARALVRRGSIQDALVACARAEELDPTLSDDPHLRLTRGLARIASREPLVALAHLEGLDGDQVRLARGVALHHAEEGEPLAELGSVLDRYPLSPWRPDVRREIEHILSPPDEHTHR